MTRTNTKPAELSPVSARHFPLVMLLFIGSGAAALIYEVVWFQMLELIIGSSAVSIGVLLATFMGGMCLGSLLLPRIIAAREHPLRVYAKLEAGIGIMGILVVLALPWVGGLYIAIGGGGVTGLIFRALFCAICLLIPTMLMGATLPAIARWVQATPQGMSWLGFFYGGNTAGAVLGCLLAGFYLLRLFDSTTASMFAVGLNAVVALAAFQLARVTPHEPQVETAEAAAARMAPGSRLVLLTIALSGLTALGAEVVWTRLLSLSLGATVYTFSLILAAFLTGIGLGSGAGSFLARSLKNPRAALGACQFLLMGALAWAAWSLTQALPYWPINPALATKPAFTFQIDLIRCIWVVLPGALLWGASFPLALASVAERGKDPGRLVGAVYAANTLGAIAGSLAASLIAIASIGTQNAQRALIVLAGLSAALMLATAATAEHERPRINARGAAWAGATAVIALFLALRVMPIPGLLVAYGRYMVTWIESAGRLIYVGEGMNSSMAVSVMSNGIMNYHNAGKVQASSDPADMRLQRMLGHLTTLIPATPSSVLVIGCGAGVTAGAVSIDPAVEHVTIAEIEPLVPFVVSKYFSEHNFAVVTNPKVKVEIDDARHFLLTTDQKFDAITSDPFDPWVRGAATLYTREFFELMKKHLNPGGVVTVFVQLYESSPAAVKSEIATFMEAFPNGTVWANTTQGQGYDLVLMGQAEPSRIDIDAIQARLMRPEYAPVAQSLGEIGMYSVIDLFSTFAGRGPELQSWMADAQINRDRNLRLQYLAGLGLNLYQQNAIYQDMVTHMRLPDDLFVGSPERLDALRSAIMGRP